MHYSSPGAGTTETLRSTGALDVTMDNLRPQLESICYGAITATRAVLPVMLAGSTGTLLYTTGISSVTPAPVFASAGMAGAALRRWALTLNSALASRGVYAGHVAIGTWIAGTLGAPEAASLKEPDDIARLYWDLHIARAPAEHLISARSGSRYLSPAGSACSSVPLTGGCPFTGRLTVNSAPSPGWLPASMRPR